MERWATFDCYGTLVDWNAGIGSGLARLLPDADAAALLARYHELEPQVEAEAYRPYAEVLAVTAQRVAAEHGLDLPDESARELSRSLPDWPVFPEARDALAEARARGWRLAILSNTDRSLLDGSMRAIGVPFDHSIVAEEVRSYKPAHRHWERFAADTGAAPDRHVHVAQSLFHDIAAANELGLRSVWINRLGETSGDGALPTRELPDLVALPDTLDQLVRP
ncbi:MAG TPA: haloacid dehalogenase type II [Gaiellaceae bacterium]|nr:haloacid dehalogenase type II [Gaiellaceae bacterium]